MLKNNASIVMPVEPSAKSYKEDKCGPNNDGSLYLNGTVQDYSKDKEIVLVNSVYIRKLAQLLLLYLPMRLFKPKAMLR